MHVEWYRQDGAGRQELQYNHTEAEMTVTTCQQFHYIIPKIITQTGALIVPSAGTPAKASSMLKKDLHI